MTAAAKVKMHPPLIFCALFRSLKTLAISKPVHVCPTVLTPGRKGHKMITQSNPENPIAEANASGEGMDRPKKKIFLRAERKFVDVSEEVYYAYYRPAWRIRDHEQRAGRCKCPQKHLWQCDGNCCECSFHSDHDIVSESSPINEGRDLSIVDLIPSEEMNPESIAIYHDLIATLKNEISQLSSDEQRIILYYLLGKTDREIASLMRKSLSTVNERKRRAISKLRNRLQDYGI